MEVLVATLIFFGSLCGSIIASLIINRLEQSKHDNIRNFNNIKDVNEE